MKKWLIWLFTKSEFCFDVNFYEWAFPLYVDFESIYGFHFGIQILCFKFIWIGQR